MKHVQVNFRESFEILSGNDRSQAAVMVLEKGEVTGSQNNIHPNSDQWLFVTRGEGLAIVNGKEVELHAGSLLLIEKGETHEIRNTGGGPLETINFYVPPAY